MELNDKLVILDESSSKAGELKLIETPVSANRYVVFLDIMGFKNRVARNKHADLLKHLSKLNDEITRIIGQFGNSNIQLAQFSDSIVLFSNDTTEDSLKNIAKAARGIMQNAIKQGIPLKGAIAQGEITCDMTKQLFFGQALIDAYLLEENVQYYGVLVHHSAEKNVQDIPNLFRDIKAPLKSGRISHYELSWYADDLKDLHVLEDIQGKLYEIRLSVSDAPRKYIDNTLDVIEKEYT